jgi:hypothetical protein
LTPAQITVLKTFTDHWTGVLKDPKSQPEDVERARGELIRPLDGSNALVASPDFRINYSKLVVSALEDAIRMDNVHAATNAVRVLAQLGTDRAINVLILQADKQNEERWQYRLRAANGCQTILKSGLLEPAKVVEAVKKLHDATGREDHNDVLRHQFAAIIAAANPTPPGGGSSAATPLTPEDRQKIRDVLITTSAEAVDRFRNGGKGEPPLAAVNPAIVDLRDKFLSPGSSLDEKKAMGKKLGPMLGKVLEIALDHWQDGHANERAKNFYGTAVGTCEGFLLRIDTQIRSGDQSPPDKLHGAWEAGNKDAFVAGLTLWQNILNQPPYEKR